MLGLIVGLGAAGGGVALAQKPPAQPAPAPQRAPAPTTKPPALGAPQQPQTPPRMATPAPAVPGKPPGAGQVPQPPVATAPPPPPQPIPANEPAGITALRQLLGSSQLSYATAEVVDAATGRARMTGVVIVDSGSRTTADEVIVEQAGREGVRYAQVRNLQAQNGNDRFAIAEMEVQNLVVRHPPGGGTPRPDGVDVERFTLRDGRLTGDVQVVLGSVLLEGWGQGRPTRIEVSGFEIGGPPRNAPFDRLRIGRMAMAGMDLAGAVAAAMAGRPATPSASEPFLEAEDLAATMQGAPVATIASLGVRSRVDATGSGTGTVAIRDVRVLPVAGLADWMRRYGYPEIRAELTLDSRYDAESGRVEISSFRLAGQDIGTLTLSLLMDGLTQDAAMRQDYGKMRLFGMSLGWLDQSILQRAVRDMAQTMRTTEAALRDQWAGMASGMLAQRGAQGLDGLRDAIVRYIRGQASEIVIRAAPPQPVPFSQLQGVGSPAQAQQILGLTATAR